MCVCVCEKEVGQVFHLGCLSWKGIVTKVDFCLPFSASGSQLFMLLFPITTFLFLTPNS